jgi:hypothetical protein
VVALWVKVLGVEAKGRERTGKEASWLVALGKDAKSWRVAF